MNKKFKYSSKLSTRDFDLFVGSEKKIPQEVREKMRDILGQSLIDKAYDALHEAWRFTGNKEVKKLRNRLEKLSVGEPLKTK